MKRNFGFQPHEGTGKYGFISYKSDDEKIVAPYAKALHDMGVKLWYDYGISAGDNWFQIISQHIIESSFMLLFVTESVFRSSVIQIEIQTAEMWNIPVIPVFIENINRNNIPKKNAALLAKLSLMQGVDKVWSMSTTYAAQSIYELITPIMASDSDANIKKRSQIVDHQTYSVPDTTYDLIVQSALTEVKEEEKSAEVRSISTKTIEAPVYNRQSYKSIPRSIHQSPPHKANSTKVISFLAVSVIVIGLIWFSINKISDFYTNVINKENTENKAKLEQLLVTYNPDEYDLPSSYEYKIDNNNSCVIITGLKDDWMTELNIPPIIENRLVTSIGVGAFEGCYEIKSVIIPDSVKEIQGSAFKRCSNLEDISLPESIIEIDGYVFDGCSSLSKIVIPNSVVSIGEFSFCECQKLSEVQLSNSLQKIDFLAFNKCSSLTEIIIPDSVTELNNAAFENCTSLKKISIPKNITKISRLTFSGCTNLISVDLPDGIEKIESEAFQNCSSLKSITIPDSVKIMGESTFHNCTSLSSITLSDSMWQIDFGCFSQCSSLHEITIPSSVTTIKGHAFSYCNHLDITMPKTVTSIAKDTFFQSSNIVIHGEKGSYAEKFANSNSCGFVAI